jgi:1-acyl-sn-glycerol-3-phosphate acyltransferase
MGRYPPLGQLGPRAIAEWGLRTQAASVTLEGRSHIPTHGPVMLVARHFHHLLDGAVLVTRTARPIHIVVGLDWAASAGQRRWLERMCQAAQYPVVLRRPTLERSGSYRREELVRYTRAALRETTALLRAGRVVLVFPEGYPNVDPARPQKRVADEWLPFEAGFLKMIEIAEGDGKTQVALVPVGFSYQPGRRWSITARIGSPVPRAQRGIAAIESAVRRLSVPQPVATVRAGTRAESVP